MTNLDIRKMSASDISAARGQCLQSENIFPHGLWYSLRESIVIILFRLYCRKKKVSHGFMQRDKNLGNEVSERTSNLLLFTA